MRIKRILKILECLSFSDDEDNGGSGPTASATASSLQPATAPVNQASATAVSHSAPPSEQASVILVDSTLNGLASALQKVRMVLIDLGY